MIHRMPHDIEQAVEENLGMAEVQGERTDYVVMTKAMYRECLGLENEREMADSMKAITEARADIAAGRTRSLEEFATEFENRPELRLRESI